MLFDLNSVSPGMKLAFQDAVRSAEEAGYRYLAVLPNSNLQLEGYSKLKLKFPLAEKTEIDISDITKFFLKGTVGVSMQGADGQHHEGESIQMRFVAFKKHEERDALIQLVKGMDFFDEEKVYILPYGGVDTRDHDLIARAAFSHNL